MRARGGGGGAPRAEERTQLRRAEDGAEGGGMEASPRPRVPSSVRADGALGRRKPGPLGGDRRGGAAATRDSSEKRGAAGLRAGEGWEGERGG